jgi:hypothetical protein
MGIGQGERGQLVARPQNRKRLLRDTLYIHISTRRGDLPCRVDDFLSPGSNA